MRNISPSFSNVLLEILSINKAFQGQGILSRNIARLHTVLNAAGSTIFKGQKHKQ